jgi:hypothetical protein
MMRVSRKISRQSRSPHVFHLPPPPRLYTPTPDGFERCMRAWVRLPTDDVPIPGAGVASASPEDDGVRDHTGGIPPTRKGHRRRRGGGLDA